MEFKLEKCLELPRLTVLNFFLNKWKIGALWALLVKILVFHKKLFSSLLASSLATPN
jgi:hypothetical protein